MRRIALLIVPLAAQFAVGCDDTSGPAPAVAIALQSGDNQTAVAGAPVLLRPSVRVTDASGAGVANVTVTFAVASGGGSITDAEPVTGSDGVAFAGGWTLGAVPGTNTLTATVAGLTGSPVTFTATATAKATALALNSGNNQSVTAGTAVAVKPSVLVTDAQGNPVANVAVTFSVASGGGIVTGAAQSTGANGIATAGNWSLGATAGTNTLTATSGGLTGSPVTFTANGTAGPAAIIAIRSGNGQSATVGTDVATKPSARVTDVNGNGVAGAAITFAVGSGGGSITGASQGSGADGSVTVGSWTLGLTAGVNTLTATASGLTGSPLTFTATGTAAAASAIAVNAGNNQSAIVGTAIVTRPAVKVTDANGNGVPGVSVTFAVASGGGSISGATQTTNASGVATVGSWTVGATSGANTLTATATGLTGSPLAFTATGVAVTAVGLSTPSVGVWEFVRVNTETGVRGTVAALAGVASVRDGESAFDPQTQRFYFVGVDPSSITRLYTINATTGAIVANPDVTAANISGIQFDAGNGQILALTRRTGVEELVRVNPSAGVVSSVGLIPGVASVQTGDVAYNVGASRYMFIGVDAAGVTRLYSVNAGTFAVISQPSLGTTAIGAIQFDVASQQLLAITFRTGGAELVKVDPQTAAITSVAFVANMASAELNNAALNATTSRFVIMGTDNAAAHRLFSLDSRTGADLGRPVTGLTSLLQLLP
jgi:hypothetical protein